MEEITPSALRQACEARYADFCRLMQGPGWFDPVHEKLCDWIQYQIEAGLAASNDLLIVKLNVVLPRGSLKTTIVTKYLPIWMVLKDCNFRTLIAMNTHPSARSKLNDIRSVFDSNDIFRALWPELLPTNNCRWNSDFAEVNRTGQFPDATFESAGTKTQKTGSHFNMIIEDDTTAPEESDMKDNQAIAPSQEVIDRGIGWHIQATPLLVPKGKRIRMIVTTRWGEDDLVSHIRKNEDYKFFDIPAELEDGTPVFTSFYSKEVLADIASQVGPYMYSCLYKNQPLDATLRTFKSEWFQWIDEDKIPLEGKRFRSIAIDPAISERDEACETAITEVLHVQQGTKAFQYWTADIHGRLNPYDQVVKTLDLAEKNSAEVRYIIVECNAYQGALKYFLRDEMIKRGIHFDIMPVHMRTDKNIRIEGMVPYFANNRIYFVRNRLTPQVESQLKQFPHGKLVDIIDCFATHQKVAKSEKAFQIIRKKVNVNPNCGEEVLKQIHDSYYKRVGQEAKIQDIDFGMPTGLGIKKDMELLKI